MSWRGYAARNFSSKEKAGRVVIADAPICLGKLLIGLGQIPRIVVTAGFRLSFAHPTAQPLIAILERHAIHVD